MYYYLPLASLSHTFIVIKRVAVLVDRVVSQVHKTLVLEVRNTQDTFQPVTPNSSYPIALALSTLPLTCLKFRTVYCVPDWFLLEEHMLVLTDEPVGTHP